MSHLETYTLERADSPADIRWLKWILAAETILRVDSLDGDQAEDGYSLDEAYVHFREGKLASEYTALVQARLRAATGGRP